jgi:hypothetical protein
MVLETKMTGRDTRRRVLSILVVLGVTCALTDWARAATSDQWRIFDPFTLKVSRVASPTSLQGVVRLRPETRITTSNGRTVAGTVMPSLPRNSTTETDSLGTTTRNLRRPIWVPSEIHLRSPYKPNYRH